MYFKKGDTIKIIAGKEKGKTGKILTINIRNNRISVEGLNLYKKHVRPKKEGEKGQVISVARSLNSSNAMIVCSNCGKTVRMGYRFEGEGKIRYCKKCQAKI